MEYMFMPYKRYFDFSGRSRRKEFWMYILFYCVVGFVATYLDSALGLGGTTTSSSEFGEGTMSFNYNMTGGVLAGIWGLVNLIPMIAVSIRRLHDTDKSGWWLLLILLIVIGWIWLFVLYVTEGTRGPNRFGPDPKGGDVQQAFN